MTAHWIINEYLEACSLPQNLAGAFPALVEPLVGIGYMPVLYCGHQRVHGTNYMLICKRTPFVPGFPSTLVKCVIHETLPVAGQRNYHIVAIEDFMVIH
ncbi:hypothetical protein CYR40_02160 [Chimaeribacter arupi]|uniref:Uncharacterized protein n=2 Tax=Yersiniaceae TaxID=1903411 RepID=A0A2N5EPM8_9GAMM|nr:MULTISPECIES: hypothetical protein [Yersiniaceae]MBS0967939.1 hypothetical protein [Nissabacter archeti]MDV5140555.1 hypothetical protein [Chimaeribacter arupi]PLR37177.1 hypothetical protein CYR23_06005 [Chimaeribacter arupi]PLR50473.1 hypothetical protein CYR40_02160 [Chimaeribacter arupi]PLR51246.1 hypothetical protein CYR34_08675 [Chimaeribacter arupi]